MPGEVSPLFGETYLKNVVLCFIPRVMWPSKPRGVGVRCAEVFFGRYGVGGIPPGTVGEAYWNGLIPGVVLVHLVFGVFLRFLDSMMRKNAGHIGAIAICAYCLVNVRPTSVNMLKTLYLFLFLFAMLYFSGLFRRRRPPAVAV